MSYEPRIGRESNWIKPMGPIIWSTKITDTLHSIMMKESLRLKKNKENRFNNNLAGNIVDEFSFSKAAQKKCVDELTFLCHNYTMVLKSEGYMMNPWNDGIPEKELQLDKIWVNFQKTGEWNPVHSHFGLFSYVVYLQVPKEIQQEAHQPHQKNNFPVAGKIVFDYGENVPFIKANHVMTPVEKDIHFFPAKLKHSVYPFKSNVERISISGNFFTPRRDWQFY